MGVFMCLISGHKKYMHYVRIVFVLSANNERIIWCGLTDGPLLLPNGVVPCGMRKLSCWMITPLLKQKSSQVALLQNHLYNENLWLHTASYI